MTKLRSWRKIGNPKTIYSKFGKFAKKQSFIDPRDGSKHEYIFVGEPDSVGIVALTKDKKIILIRQFKQAADEILTEVPAGIIDKGESPLAAAKRELEEETGYGSENIKQVGRFMRSTRSIPTHSYTFLALNCYKIKNPKIDDVEELEIVIKPFKNWVAEVKKGKVLDCLSVIDTLLAVDHLKNGK